MPVFSSRIQRGKYDPVDEAKKILLKRRMKVMISFTVDPYPPYEEQERVTRRVLEVLRFSNHTVMILTKNPGLAYRLDLDLIKMFRSRIMVGSTIISLEKTPLEPKAPPPEERIEALRKFKQSGVRTWISMEPIIPGVTDVVKIIKATLNFCDFYVLGAYNYHAQLRKHTGIVVTDAELRSFYQNTVPYALQLLKKANKKFFVKKELRKYLVNNHADHRSL